MGMVLVVGIRWCCSGIVGQGNGVGSSFEGALHHALLVITPKTAKPNSHKLMFTSGVGVILAKAIDRGPAAFTTGSLKPNRAIR